MGLRRTLLRIAKGIVMVAIALDISLFNTALVEAAALARSMDIGAPNTQTSTSTDDLSPDEPSDGPVYRSADSHPRPVDTPSSAPHGKPARTTDFSGTETQRVYYQYLPVVVKRTGPDLVIEDLAAEANLIEVLITNEGDSPVTKEFWVDVYIDPTTPPTHVNQTWDMLGERGVVWGVTADLLPIPPGESLTLTVGDAHYWPSLSNFPEPLAPGTPVYIQVDSVNTETSYGNVLESHEIRGGAYNNIDKILSSTGSFLSTSSTAGFPVEDVSGLPTRQ